ncbi:alpha/beta hydrolase [Actinocatenispora rupis]|uniref:Hydrolase n=2 Tax=Actinocatenispora rupis TaxID=519421 RepID=A0A8J3JAX0_9ACTN|nr:hydrolase [Actinocatenispora rupis]
MAMTNAQFLEVPGGRLGYDVQGPADGPLVVCAPGMGDIRQMYRFLTPRLVAAGYRVATVDLRGHGDSTGRWDSYAPEAVGADLLALVDHLGGPAVLVGTSYSPSSAVWAAAREPKKVVGLVLISMFTSNPAMNPLLRLISGQVMSRVPLWLTYYKSLYATLPADFAEYRGMVRAGLKRNGMTAVRAMGLADKSEANAAIAAVDCPTLVLYGSKDPDFPDPAAQAEEARRLLPHATVEIIDGVKHYPAAESPDAVAPSVLALLKAAFDA